MNITTNSPNPVDGDVQALIADCKAEIAEIEKALTTWGDVWIPSLQSKLNRQKVALAALTAEPGIFEWRFRDTEGSLPSPWVTLGMDKLEQCRNTFGDMVEYRFWFPTPPAQLLRPVELPPKSDVKMGGDAKTRALLTGMNMMLKSCTEALRQQGYEVKND